jgi:hypothetical protein
MTFIDFIIKSQQHKRYMWIALASTVIQIIVFKLLYPFADFFSDSYSYIYAASTNLDINIWPIGYSKFLRLFHFITYSDTALVAFQYFFLELSAVYFFFTVLYFYAPVKTNQAILFIFLFFNPLFIYISNYVNSDPLFIALSLFWLTELLWILHRPNWYHIVIQALLLFVAFTVRNNAYIYPFVTIVAFALSRLHLWIKVSGAALGLLLIIPFIMHTRNAAYKMTGTKQFSLFTGWQLANNALYMYEYADTSKQLSTPGKELDKLSTRFYHKVPKVFRTKYLLTNQGNFFIQHPGSPLKKYFIKHYKLTDFYSEVVAWGKSSVVFEEFGAYLIKHNPTAYFHEFMIPNSKNYFIPHLEKLRVYNQGEDSVNKLAKQWFHYKSNRVQSVSPKVQRIVLFIFPSLFLMINAYLLMNIVLFWLRKKYKVNNEFFNRSILLIILFLLGNFIFSVSVTIIVMRYQVFPMITSLFSGLLLSEWLHRKELPRKQPIWEMKNELSLSFR